MLSRIELCALNSITKFISMKKICLLATLIVSLHAQAQLEKGCWMPGGSIAFKSVKYSGSNNSSTSTILQLQPSLGYFFADKIAGGIQVNFSNTHVSPPDDNYSSLLAGPWARYYFLPANKKTNLFFQASYNIGREKYRHYNAQRLSDFGFSAGPSFFLNKYISFETAIYWKQNKYSSEPDHYNTIGISIGLQAYLHPAEGKGKSRPN